jgi:hypothetical protein
MDRHRVVDFPGKVPAAQAVASLLVLLAVTTD